MSAPRPRWSLRRILTLAIAGVSLGAVVLTGGLTLGLVRLTAERTTTTDLRRDLDRLTRIQGNLDDARPPKVRARRSPGGDVLFVPANQPSPLLELPSKGRGTIGGREVLYVARDVDLRGRPGRLFVYRPTADVPGIPPGLALRVALAGLVALALSALVASLVARRVASPLRDLADAARGLARGQRTILPGDRGPAEIDELRTAFEEMADDLAAGRERERAFLLSVSHELRTPLTAIRGYGEALSDGTARGAGKAGDVIVRESQRLERLVQDLIDLARLEAGEFSVVNEEVDLGRLARRAAESFRLRAREADVRLEVEADAAAPVVTDPDRVHQMLANLVENALRVSPRSGRVTILATGKSVSVSDSGPGLDPEDIDHAFDRFYLWRKYRGERAVGTGLGLAIVEELGRRLGVRLAVHSQPGAGTTFTLLFDA